MMTVEQRPLGGDGPALSVVGLGCNNFGMKLDHDDSIAVIEAALDAGITHFDTAEMYGGGKSEEWVGEALASRRDEVVIASKFMPRPGDEAYTPGALRKRILDGIDTSLTRLGTDRIDLYYQHYPDAEAPGRGGARDPQAVSSTPARVVHIASSNFSADQIAEAAAVSADKAIPRYCGTQIEWSLLSRDVEESIVPAARAQLGGRRALLPACVGLAHRQVPPGRGVPRGFTLRLHGVFRGRCDRGELRPGRGAHRASPRRTATPSSSSPSPGSRPKTVLRRSSVARRAPRRCVRQCCGRRVADDARSTCRRCRREPTRSLT